MARRARGYAGCSRSWPPTARDGRYTANLNGDARPPPPTAFPEREARPHRPQPAWRATACRTSWDCRLTAQGEFDAVGGGVVLVEAGQAGGQWAYGAGADRAGVDHCHRGD